MTDQTPSDVTAHGAQRIKIFDTTLRDGEQSPGFTMNAAQKILFAHALEELGVDVIEAGFPNSSPADFGAVQSIAREIRHASICALARCHPADIDACGSALQGAANPRIHVFISTSPLHRQHKLNMSEEQVIEHAIMGVTRARSHVDDVEFSAEDALRTEPEFLVRVFDPRSKPARARSTCPTPSATPRPAKSAHYSNTCART